MSLTRRLKREYERKNRKKEMSELYAHVDRVSARMDKEYKEAQLTEDAKNMSVAMYYLFGLGLHEIYGFSALRLSRLFEWVDAELGTWRRDEVTIQKLKQRLYDETGVQIEL